MNVQPRARRAAGHVDTDDVLNAALARLVDHFVPCDLAAGEMPHLVELRELQEVEPIGIIATPVAMPAINIAGPVADDADGLLVRTIAGVVQQVDPAGA